MSMQEATQNKPDQLIVLIGLPHDEINPDSGPLQYAGGTTKGASPGSSSQDRWIKDGGVFRRGDRERESDRLDWLGNKTGKSRRIELQFNLFENLLPITQQPIASHSGFGFAVSHTARECDLPPGMIGEFSR